MFILTEYFDCINEVVHVKINGVSYPIKVVEDPLAETSWEKRVFTSIEIKKGHVIDGKEVLVEIDPKDDNSFDFDAHEAQDKGISEESWINLLDGVVLPTVDESDDNSFCSVDPTCVKVEDDGRDDELGGGLESFIGDSYLPNLGDQAQFSNLNVMDNSNSFVEESNSPLGNIHYAERAIHVENWKEDNQAEKNIFEEGVAYTSSGTQLCSISEIMENKKNEAGFSEIEERLNMVQNQVMKWEVDEYMIWDCGSEEASEARDVLNMAMARLEEEFRHILVKNRQFFKAYTSFRSSEEDVETEGSFISSGHGSVEDPFKHLLVQCRQPFEPERVSFRPREIYVGNEWSNILVKNRQSFTSDASFGSSEEDVETVGSFISSGHGSVDDPFKHLLVQGRQPSEPEHVSFRPREIYVGNEGFMITPGDESVEDWILRDNISKRSSEDFIIDFVHPSVIPDLKCIAKMMLESNCDRECTQAFISVQKDALDDCLSIFAVEKPAIEDLLKMELLKMEWDILTWKIRRWIQAMKIFVRVYLASEKRLSDQIFGDFASFSSVCFGKASKASMLQVLNFCEAIASQPHQPEKLIPILGMYEVLADLIPEIDALYTDEVDSYVRHQCQYVLRRLGCCVKATFLQFENLVASHISTTPFLDGGIHPLSEYVVNLVICLIDYTETLNLLLKDSGEENVVSYSTHLNSTVEDKASGRSSLCVSPMALHFQSLISILEANLDHKSKLYKDDSLGHLFLMKNTHYLAQKVNSSELRNILGEQWIHKHTLKFQQHAMSYERATWSSILSLLSFEEGIEDPSLNSASRTKARQRIQSFQDVYKRHTNWLIPDSELRKDLQISTFIKMIQAYRSFVGRNCVDLGYENIEYSADDLDNFPFDLFEGHPRSLHGHRRK
ncbi:hypothetical protein Vadar_027049 [Vaccinium darrowii]|uniref:Uncharacterized protein n=1 Tax=Vaccinium darrowii TaxID=229202 RepID=A0ACB7Y2U5_9ERIC|nr:hypothetical protein Vadar_027049 [Vaccinium darrowii]